MNAADIWGSPVELDDGLCPHGFPPRAFCPSCSGIEPVDPEDHDPAALLDDPACAVTPDDRGIVDWGEFWQRERPVLDFIVPGLLPEAAAASIYSTAGGGKSLLALEWALCKATGQPIMGEPVSPGHVLYVDHEMDRDLLEDRLLALGADEHTDLHRLHYSLLGDWPPLDTQEGGQALLTAAQHIGAALVIVDTISRAIEGEENPADTWLRLYRHSVRRLKQAGIAFLRLDHSGKDATKGERGSSAKRSDVDLVYKVEPVSAERINLVRQKNRVHLPGPDVTALARRSDPLRHQPVTVDAQRERKISELVDVMQRLDLPLDTGRDRIRRELKGAGIAVRNADLSAAIARRRAAGPPPVPTLRVGDSGDRSAPSLGDSRGQVRDRPGTGLDRTAGQPQSTPVPTESGTGQDDLTTGPGATCGHPTHRYGDGGSPLCDPCRSAAPATAAPLWSS